MNPVEETVKIVYSGGEIRIRTDSYFNGKRTHTTTTENIYKGYCPSKTARSSEVVDYCMYKTGNGQVAHRLQ
jgi:hypothetical protein